MRAAVWLGMKVQLCIHTLFECCCLLVLFSSHYTLQQIDSLLAQREAAPETMLSLNEPA